MRSGSSPRRCHGPQRRRTLSTKTVLFPTAPIFRDVQTGRFVAGAPSALVALDGAL
jgi:hypothetical protein